MDYEDEGDSYNYEKGKFSVIKFFWDEAMHTLTIAPRRGSFKGMLEHRKFRVVLAGADRGADNFPMTPTKTVEYNGKAMKVIL